MLTLVATVLIASLLGSLHCAGMCGAFVAVAVDCGGRVTLGPGLRREPQWPMHLAYHGGRLLTYMTLGVISGALGAAIDAGGAFAGVQRAAAILAGGLMVAYGAVMLARIAGVPLGPLGAGSNTLIARAVRRVTTLPAFHRAGALGLLTTLLPCGWLYMFVISAGATASPLLGALVMAAFWAGTVPVLLSLGVGVRMASAALRRYIPTITSLAVVAIGVFTMLGRLGTSPEALAALARRPAASSAVENAAHAAEEEMPCCHSEEP
ncbi:MAG: hypothetical protein AMXMBFR47_16230 [Planctomycetota bacterium]